MKLATGDMQGLDAARAIDSAWDQAVLNRGGPVPALPGMCRNEIVAIGQGTPWQCRASQRLHHHNTPSCPGPDYGSLCNPPC